MTARKTGVNGRQTDGQLTDNQKTQSLYCRFFGRDKNVLLVFTWCTWLLAVKRYRDAGSIRLRLSEQMGLEVSFEGVHSMTGSNVGW